MTNPLYIFDFDDTLVFSGAAVHITHGDGNKESLESHEFATYKPRPGDQFDFSEFDVYPPNGQIIQKTFNKMKTAIATAGVQNVVVLSARGKSQPMKDFLSDNGLTDPIEIVGVHSSNPVAKANFVSGKIADKGYDEVYLYEDSMDNIDAIKAMIEKTYPGVTFTSHHVQAESLLRKTIHNLLRETILCFKRG